MAETISTSDALFLGKDQQVQSTYHRLLEALHALGPFQEEPKKTSIHKEKDALLAAFSERNCLWQHL